MKLNLPVIALLTERTALPEGMPLAQVVGPAVSAGVGLVVFREVDLPEAPRLAVARFVRDAVRGRVPMVATGPLAHAAQMGLAGLHTPDAPSAALAREQLGIEALVGVTAATPDEAAAAERAGADYLICPLDWTQPEAALERLRALCAATSLPVLAGVETPLEQVAACLAAGAKGVTVSSAILGAGDPAVATRAYARALEG